MTDVQSKTPIRIVCEGDPITSAKQDAWNLCVLTMYQNEVLDWAQMIEVRDANPYSKWNRQSSEVAS